VALDAASQLFDHNDIVRVITDAAGGLPAGGAGVTFVYAGTSAMTQFAADAASGPTQLLGRFTFRSGADAFGAGTRGVGASDALLHGMRGAQAAAIGGTLEAGRTELTTTPSLGRAQYLAESMAPIINRANLETALDIARQTYGRATDRMAALRTADGATPGQQVWGRVFARDAEQDARKGLQGYDADARGFTLGADTKLNDGAGATLGVAFTYADTEVDSKAGPRSEEDIETYQITLYGEHALPAQAYLAAQAFYAWQDVSTRRYDVGGTGAVADGDYDAQALGARAELGRPVETGALGGLVLTPTVFAEYVHYSADAYTETGAGTADLRVDYDDADALDLGAGLEAGWDIAQASGAVLSPRVRAGVRHDVIADEVAATSTFRGGGPAFRTVGAEPSATTLSAGVEINYRLAESWEVAASYDADWRSDYDAQVGMVRATYKF